nr:NUDIX hydrolase [Bacilli bacterium]
MALKEYNMQLEGLLSIFTADKSQLKVLLVRKTTDPYKGYWVLPGDMVKVDETIEDNISNIIYDKLGIKSLYVEQIHTYSTIDRNPDSRVVAVNYLGLIDPVTLLLKKEDREIEMEWFPINDLPKLGYDHLDIIEKTKTLLGSKLLNINYIKNLFPADFTLPEIEKVITSILNLNIDRRNFRKRLLKLNIIEETGEYEPSGNGRPAKLYRFKDDIKDINIY